MESVILDVADGTVFSYVVNQAIITPIGGVFSKKLITNQEDLGNSTPENPISPIEVLEPFQEVQVVFRRNATEEVSERDVEIANRHIPLETYIEHFYPFVLGKATQENKDAINYLLQQENPNLSLK